jgi:uncharacterized protein involved in high-affinity Fe2+ transport
VPERRTGPIIVLSILGGVALILAVNLNFRGWKPRSGGPGDAVPSHQPAASSPSSGAGDRAAGVTVRAPADFREYPIGDEVEKNQMRIGAVWLPPVQMDGMAIPESSAMIHLEADIHATAGNRNGCAKDEFIPYLTVNYTIEPEGTERNSAGTIAGKLMPMVARDGWHYGASIEMPKPGRYKLTYSIEPPSAGRHVDPATGVEAWWKPFAVSFDWDYSGPPQARP